MPVPINNSSSQIEATPQKSYAASRLSCFGYVNVYSKEIPTILKPIVTKTNIASALCWIPFIGSIIGGVIRWRAWNSPEAKLLAAQTNDAKSFQIGRRAQKIRAGFEMAGVGFIFTGADLGFFAVKSLNAVRKQYSKTSSSKSKVPSHGG